MGPLGFNEILIILIIVLILFGAQKFPEIMRGLGRGMREFNEGKNEAPKKEPEGDEKENTPPSA